MVVRQRTFQDRVVGEALLVLGVATQEIAERAARRDQPGGCGNRVAEVLDGLDDLTIGLLNQTEILIGHGAGRFKLSGASG